MVAYAVPLIGESISSFEFTPQNICLLMADRTFIADPYNCNIYYKCDKGLASYLTCPDGHFFNKNTGNCDSQVCHNINTRCLGIAKGTYLEDYNSCNGYYICDGGNVAGTHGYCEGERNFDPHSQSCVYSDNYPCSKHSMQPICLYVPNNKHFGVRENCAEWAICDNGQYKSGICSVGVFDSKYGVCNENVSEVQCQDGSQGLQGTDCSSWTSQFMEDPQHCSGYYYCNIQKKSLWAQCENHNFFSNGKCVNRSTVICNKGNNPCENTENSNYKWVNDPTDCRKYFFCSNNTNYPIPSICPNDSWFDEILQQCTMKKPTYEACVAKDTTTGEESNCVAKSVKSCSEYYYSCDGPVCQLEFR